jgi:hypothetical protein
MERDDIVAIRVVCHGYRLSIRLQERDKRTSSARNPALQILSQGKYCPNHLTCQAFFARNRYPQGLDSAPGFTTAADTEARGECGIRTKGAVCRASGAGSILRDDFACLGILVTPIHLGQDDSCFRVNDPAVSPRIKFTGPRIHGSPLLFLHGRGRIGRTRTRPGGNGRISRRPRGRRGRRIMLGRHGGVGLRKDRGSASEQQNHQDPCYS